MESVELIVISLSATNRNNTATALQQHSNGTATNKIFSTKN